jgi:uncharacterized membrane protein YhiD involved in acid resistance
MDNTISFTDILETSTAGLSGGGTITVAAVLISLTASLVCGLLIALVYRQAYQGVLFQKSYAVTIVLVTLVTTMVIMVISGNLVLSLGMVGALSIVRFRAAIKDPLDIVYIFWAVGVGIANGVAYFSVSFISSIFIAICLIALKKIPSRPKSKLVIINCDQSSAETVSNHVNSLSKKVSLRSQTNKLDSCELVFEIMSFDSANNFDAIKDITGVEQVRLINYAANN